MLSTFLSKLRSSPVFSVAPCVGFVRVMFEYNLYPTDFL